MDGEYENRLIKLIQELKNRGLKITTAESCTGGLLASRLVDVPGASSVFERGYITYSEKAKVEELGVSLKTIEQFGVVSEDVAREMVVGVANKASADIALSITGIAGPDGGTKEKPVGLVFIGCYVKGVSQVQKKFFSGTRTQVREKAAIEAIMFACEILTKSL